MKRIFLLAFAIIAMPGVLLADGDIRFYGPCWTDSSGKDGKGGVSILCSGDKHSFVLRPEACKEKIDPRAVGDHPEWVVYDGAETGDGLSYEWTYVTTADDKFFGKKWAGGGLAFNNSWAPLSLAQAKYLVFYVKSNAPDADLNLALTGLTEQSQTGNVKLSDFADGRKIGKDWTRVAVPLAAFPNLSKLDLTQVKTIRFDLAGDFPENKPLYIRLDKVFFSDASLVTPVENLGWIRVPGGVEVVWDKSNDEGVERYLVTVDGKPAGRVEGPGKRKVKVPVSVLPGTGPHVVGVASANAKQSSSVQSVTVTLAPPASATASVSLSGELGRPISPYIYGFNYMGSESLKKLGGTLNRWGGNATTNYNWKEDADNRGADWYFLNTAASPKGSPEKDKGYYKFVRDAFAAGAQPIITIPINGWVAKAPPAGGPELGSFPLSLFPGQTGNDGQGSGNGQLPGNKLVWGNDPALNYVPSDPEFQKEWVVTMMREFGTAAKGGVRFYQMDNEPGLWCWNHRDCRPKGVGYDELADLNARYSEAVKSADPDAQVIGFVAWGAKELAGSAWDFMPGGVQGYQLPESAAKSDAERWTDRKAHGDLPQVAWFLKEMNRRSQKAGKRLLDYLDDHGYPEVWGKNAKGENVNVLGDYPYDPVLTPKQFDAMRIFWDPTFEDPDSWCANKELKPYLFDPFKALIPSLKKMIDEYYPGTKLAMTEYYPASAHYYHGGLLQAVNLGVFMREGMDLACDWGSAWEGNYTFLGHQLFSNYDGQGSKVGGNVVNSTSSSGDLYSFGARDGAKTFLVLVNKNHDAALRTAITLPAPVAGYRTYTMSETVGKRLYDSGPLAASGKELSIDVPAFSAILVTAQ